MSKFRSLDLTFNLKSMNDSVSFSKNLKRLFHIDGPLLYILKLLIDSFNLGFFRSCFNTVQFRKNCRVVTRSFSKI